MSSSSETIDKANKAEKEEPGEEKAAEEEELDAEALKAKKAAEAVTDHISEKEGGDLASAVEAERSLTLHKPKESAFKGTINAEDLAVVMDECDMSKEDADALLKRGYGSLEKSLELFVAR